MFRLTKSSSGLAKNNEVLYNVAVRIWDPRWLTVCAVIRTVDVTCLYICYTIVPAMGVKYVTCVSVLSPGIVVR